MTDKRRHRRQWLGPLLLGLLVGGLGTAVSLKLLRSRRALPVTPPVMTVNGRAVSRSEFQGLLEVTSGPRVLQSLLAQSLVEQEAERRKLRLTPDEEKSLDESTRELVNPDLAQPTRRLLRSALLERKLLLEGVSEQARREIYNLFREQLIEYELFVILLASRKDGQQVARELQDGAHFDRLARDLSLDSSSRDSGGRLGYWTFPQIELLLGHDVADTVLKLKSNSVSQAVYSNQGLMVVKLGRVRSSYEELKPAVEGLLCESRRGEVWASLMESTRVSSPFLVKGDMPVAPRIDPAQPASEVFLPKPTQEPPAGTVNGLGPLPTNAPGQPPKTLLKPNPTPGTINQLPRPESS